MIIKFMPWFTKKKPNITKRVKKMSFFKQREFVCPDCGEVKVSGYLIHMLNKIRSVYGKPMIINSGYRCKEYNKKVGGKPSSAHLRGTAADIKCDNATDRFLLVSLACEAGFRRVGVYSDFVHLDVDDTLPRPVMWIL